MSVRLPPKLTLEQAKERFARVSVSGFEERFCALDIDPDPAPVSAAALDAPQPRTDFRVDPPELPQTREQAIALFGLGSQALAEWDARAWTTLEQASAEAERFAERNRKRRSARMAQPWATAKRNRESAQRSSKTGRFDRRAPIEITSAGDDSPQYLYVSIDRGSNRSSRQQRQQWAEVEVVEDPDCPRCGGWMLRRMNSKTGEGFWGCMSWPQCNGTLNFVRYRPVGHVLPR